jgi:predicted ATPase
LIVTVSAHLRERRLLLLLDNFEVVDEAAPVLGELLQAAPGLALLVTSRLPLRLTGEHEYRVAPLPLSTAVQLFAERARAVAPGFRRPSEEAEEVAELCRRVDCLPLAIELAAARTRDYAPAELLQLFPGSLELASDGARDFPGRHRALRATIDWSYELLPGEERTLFARLAVFAGGWSAAAAAAVCDAPRSGLASLVGKSLVHERLGAEGEARYFMLETVREYALERLDDTGERDVLVRRHAEHYAALAEAAEEQPAAAAGQTAWAGLHEEQENLRAALDWSHSACELEIEFRLVAALAYFWTVRGQLSEGRARLESALERGDRAPAPLRAKALFGAARFANSLGDDDRMRALMEECLVVYRSLGDEPGIARSLYGLGIAVSNLGDHARGIALNQEAAVIYRKLGDDRGLAITLNNQGSLLLGVGDAEGARAVLEEALAVFETLGLLDRLPVVLGNLGIAELVADRPADALDCFRRSLAIARDLDFTEAQIYALEGVAAALAASSQEERAATLLGAAHAAAEIAGVVLEPLERRVHDETTRALKDALGEDAFVELHGAGRHVELAAACASALSESEPQGKAVEPRST